jgi:hypothetical protein
MTQTRQFKSFQSFFSKHMRGKYFNIADDEPETESLSPEPDVDKEIDSLIRDSNIRKKKRAQMIIIYCLSILISIIVTTAIITARSDSCESPTTRTKASGSNIKPFSKSLPEISNLVPKSCGHNSTTARSLGCHFDIMSMIWIPHECYDPDLSMSFLAEKKAKGGWEWSHHENGTDLIPEHEIRKGDIQHGWVRFEYHLTHCLYTWRKLNRQVERGGAPIDGYISNSTHTEHCSRMLGLRSIPGETWNTPFKVLYPTCYV